MNEHQPLLVASARGTHLDERLVVGCISSQGGSGRWAQHLVHRCADRDPRRVSLGRPLVILHEDMPVQVHPRRPDRAEERVRAFGEDVREIFEPCATIDSQNQTLGHLAQLQLDIKVRRAGEDRSHILPGHQRLRQRHASAVPQVVEARHPLGRTEHQLYLRQGQPHPPQKPDQTSLGHLSSGQEPSLVGCTPPLRRLTSESAGSVTHGLR